MLKWIHDKFFLNPRLARARQAVRCFASRRQPRPPPDARARARSPQRKAFAKAVNAGEMQLSADEKFRIHSAHPARAAAPCHQLHC